MNGAPRQSDQVRSGSSVLPQRTLRVIEVPFGASFRQEARPQVANDRASSTRDS